MIYGYARVSTAKRGTDGEYVQSFDLQKDALVAAGVAPERIYEDRASGMKSARPGLAALLADVQDGDDVLVWKLDRLGRSARDLLNTAHSLRDRNIGIRSLQDGIDTRGALGQFLLTILSAVAEMEHDSISERVTAGIAASKRRGGRNGRKQALSPAARDDVRASALAGSSISELARRYRVGRATIHRVIQNQGAV
jgi:DNA invertase Pin-like site-specific DNA recombinase